MTMKTKPVHEIRLGLIKACVWRKRRQSTTKHTVSVVRLYRDGDEWKQSSRFGRDDIPVVREALDRAYEWIFRHTRSDEGSA